MRVTGHLFQARFSSVVMDEDHLMAVARYVTPNPVRARLVATPEDWPWSSVGAHLARRDEGLVEVAPLVERRGGRFADLLAEEPDPPRSPRCAPPRRSAARSARAPSSTRSRR
jgi:putative transposase